MQVAYLAAQRGSGRAFKLLVNYGRRKIQDASLPLGKDIEALIKAFNEVGELIPQTDQTYDNISPESDEAGNGQLQEDEKLNDDNLPEGAEKYAATVVKEILGEIISSAANAAAEYQFIPNSQAAPMDSKKQENFPPNLADNPIDKDVESETADEGSLEEPLLIRVLKAGPPQRLEGYKSFTANLKNKKETRASRGRKWAPDLRRDSCKFNDLLLSCYFPSWALVKAFRLTFR